MVERRDTPAEVSRLYIPEAKFWTDDAAEIYLDDEGKLKRSDSKGNYPFELLEKPIISDEYPIVDIPAFAEQLKSLFVPDSKFPRVYRKDISRKLAAQGIDITNKNKYENINTADNIEHVQEQKHFREGRKVIDLDDYKFCNNPERTMEVPWVINNVIAEIYADTVKPDKEIGMAHRVGADVSSMMLGQQY